MPLFISISILLYNTDVVQRLKMCERHVQRSSSHERERVECIPFYIYISLGLFYSSLSLSLCLTLFKESGSRPSRLYVSTSTYTTTRGYYTMPQTITVTKNDLIDYDPYNLYYWMALFIIHLILYEVQRVTGFFFPFYRQRAKFF